MVWRETIADENYPVLKRQSGPKGLWEAGITPMLFGYRVRLGPTGHAWCTLDYCAGAAISDAMALLQIVLTICAKMPERTYEFELAALFPPETIKPIWDDRKCLQSLSAALASSLKDGAVDRERTSNPIQERTG
jgi:hypothetical protein